MANPPINTPSFALSFKFIKGSVDSENIVYVSGMYWRNTLNGRQPVWVQMSWYRTSDSPERVWCNGSISRLDIHDPDRVLSAIERLATSLLDQKPMSDQGIAIEVFLMPETVTEDGQPI